VGVADDEFRLRARDEAILFGFRAEHIGDGAGNAAVGGRLAEDGVEIGDRRAEAGEARRAADRAFSDVVQDEDIAICEAVQRGLASGSYEAGRLNPLRENAVHHFHERVRSAYREADTIR